MFKIRHTAFWFDWRTTLSLPRFLRKAWLPWEFTNKLIYESEWLNWPFRKCRCTECDITCHFFKQPTWNETWIRVLFFFWRGLIQVLFFFIPHKELNSLYRIHRVITILKQQSHGFHLSEGMSSYFHNQFEVTNSRSRSSYAVALIWYQLPTGEGPTAFPGIPWLHSLKW